MLQHNCQSQLSSLQLQLKLTFSFISKFSPPPPHPALLGKSSRLKCRPVPGKPTFQLQSQLAQQSAPASWQLASSQQVASLSYFIPPLPPRPCQYSLSCASPKLPALSKCQLAVLSLAQLSPSLFDILLTVIITVFYDNIEERTCAGWSGGWVLHTTQVQVTMGIKTAVMAKENIADIVQSPTSILIKSCFVYIHLSILLKYVQLLRLRGACKKNYESLDICPNWVYPTYLVPQYGQK